MPDPHPNPQIEIAAAIQNLRSELLKALDEGRGQALQFKLRPVELELKVAITRDAKAHAGVKFWVLDAGAEGTLGDATTHTLKLTLEPLGKDGGEFMISKTGEPEPP